MKSAYTVYAALWLAFCLAMLYLAIESRFDTSVSFLSGFMSGLASLGLVVVLNALAGKR